MGRVRVFAAMGALLVGKRPRNAVGWIISAAALLIGLAPTGDSTPPGS